MSGSRGWQAHGAWVTETQPAFGPGVKERFRMAASITPDELASAQARRAAITEHLKQMLGDDSLLVLPTSPGPAPLRSAGESGLDSFRTAALELLCAAGLAGLPQISIPVSTVDGGPVGLSIIAPPSQDGQLLSTAIWLAETFENEA
jgi:amidase